VTRSGPRRPCGADRQQYYHYDGLGSARALTNNTGTTVATYNYDVFGTIRSQTGSQTNNFLFTGEWRDPETGFYLLRARYYDPVVGRLINRDPWPGAANNPASANRYVYAQNDPVNFADPSGYRPFCIAAVALASPDVVLLAGGAIAALWAELYIQTHLDEIQAAGETLQRIIFASNPYGSRGGPAHRERINERIKELEEQGWEHIGGGSKKETIIRTPEGRKAIGAQTSLCGALKRGSYITRM